MQLYIACMYVHTVESAHTCTYDSRLYGTNLIDKFEDRGLRFGCAITLL